MDKKEKKMGQIINTKTMPDKTVVCKVLLDSDEIINLKGHLKNVHLFSSQKCDKESSINTRGNNGVTKYFKIPLSIRSRKKHSGVLRYQKLDTPAKVYYIYTLNTALREEEQELEENNLENEKEEE